MDPLPAVRAGMRRSARCSCFRTYRERLKVPRVRPFLAGNPSSRQCASEHLEIRVATNGIGIDRAPERIFELFQRLLYARAFEGTGIGSRCVRDRPTWAEIGRRRTRGAGRVFAFTLPAAEVEREKAAIRPGEPSADELEMARVANRFETSRPAGRTCPGGAYSVQRGNQRASDCRQLLLSWLGSLQIPLSLVSLI
jgi:hypothetical protein